MLNPDEYAPGSTLKSPDGEKLTVQDQVQGNNGQYLVVVRKDKPGEPSLVPVAVLRDEETDWEASEPDEESDDVTDAPDVTSSQDTSPQEGETSSPKSPSPGSKKR